MITIRDTQERALNGKVVDEKDYDMKILPAKLRELVKQYDIKYNPEQLMPNDVSLCKDVFDAALDLVEDLGLYCPDTGRTVTFTREEVMETLRTRPKSITLGEGVDARTMTVRKPEDKKIPVIHMAGPIGTVVTEELFIPTHQAFVESGCDVLYSGILKSVNGFESKAGFPSEILAGMTEGLYCREAIKRAGKPGMAIMGVNSVSTPQATYAAFYPEGFRADVDILYTAYPAEMRLLNKHLQRSLWCRQRGIMEFIRHMSIYGVYTGPVEAATICAVAAGLGGVVAGNYRNVLVCNTNDRYGAADRPETLWGSNLVQQTIKRNTDLMVWGGAASCSGACTETCLWELSRAAASAANGGDLFMDGFTSGGIDDNSQTPLEYKFTREVVDAAIASGMKLSDANEFLKEIMPKFLGKINFKEHTPRGKTFPECYNLKTLTPSEEWLGIYKKVKAELTDMGYFAFE